MPREHLLQIRGGTAAEWAATNPVLAEREPGYETDTRRTKYGDGVTAWNSLSYVAGEDGASEISDIDGLQEALDAKADADDLAALDAEVDALNTSTTSALAGKANTSHNQAISTITNLQTTLDGKADDSEITTLTTSVNAKVAKSGDTMTGPLILSGAPSLSLHAATKAYVDSLVGALPRGIYLSSTYNASGSSAQTTGSISASSNQLTVASAASFSVGQGIYIAGAGVAGAPLVTTIFGISGNVLTLVDNASTTVSSALVQHDDSAAINAAMGAAVNSGGGEVWFEPGFYRCNGPFQASNSILAPPYTAVVDGSPLSLVLRALAPPPWLSFDGPPSNQGVIIQTDKIGADEDSSLFAAAEWVGGTDWEPFNNIVIYIDGVQFRTYDNPQINALDLGMSGGAWIKHVFVETGVQLQNGTESDYNRFGIRMPRVNAATGFARCELSYVMNYNYGFIAAESLGLNQYVPLRCRMGVRMDFNYHPSMAQINAWQCPTVAEFTDRSIVDWNLNIENAPDGFWYSPVSGHHVYDPTDQLHGVIRYSSIRSATGADVAISNTGASSVAFTNLRA